MGTRLLAGLVLLASLHCEAQVSNRPGVLSSPGGRYVFGQISEFRGDQYLLDTQTGRLWTLITYCNDMTKKESCGKPVLRLVEFDVFASPELVNAMIAQPPSHAASAQPLPDPKKK